MTAGRRAGQQKTTRFSGVENEEEEDDFVLNDDDDEGAEADEQLEKMKRLEAERGKPPRGNVPMSAYTNSNNRATRIVDLTSDQVSYGIRPSTSVQLDQIKALNEFNKALPKKKQNLAFPMIQSYNIGTTQSIKKDHKKKKVELITKYHPLGIIEDNFYKDEEDAYSKKFSYEEKVRTLSQQSSRKKIETIRKQSGKLINA